jgi:oligopeptide/dipeptide ABC transporter ATP-binding protein
MSSGNEIVTVKDLKKYYPVERGIFGSDKHSFVRAVDNISFSIVQGETFTLVGESGSGKTTTAKTILRLIEPTSGTIYFEQKNVLECSKKEMRDIRRRMQIIFQNPYLSLNPRMKIGSIIAEPLFIHKIARGEEARRQTSDLLEAVGLTPAEQFYNRYPHQLSGGQRQRVMIARVLSLSPNFIIADEPVSALDVSLRSQILNLLQDLKSSYRLTYLLITHDLSVVEYMGDRTAVMYLGKIVELGRTEDVLNSPLHPYTEMLIAAVPVPDPSVKINLVPIGDIPSPLNLPKGCRFNPRCPHAFERCKIEEPSLIEAKPGHFAACFLNEKN